MPKSKSNKKRKNKLVAFKNKLQADRKKLRDNFVKTLEEAHAKAMDEKVNSGRTETDVEGMGDFSMDNQQPTQQQASESMGLSELGLDVQQVELTGAPPDSFSGIVK